MARHHNTDHRWSRRRFLRHLGVAPTLLGIPSSTLLGFAPGLSAEFADPLPDPSFADPRYHPRYPVRSPLEAVLKLVAPGTDDYVEERYATEIQDVLAHWTTCLQSGRLEDLAPTLDPALEAHILKPARITPLRQPGVVASERHEYDPALAPNAAATFPQTLAQWLGPAHKAERSTFEIIAIQATPLTVTATIRYDFLLNLGDGRREQRIGTWQTTWTSHAAAPRWTLRRFEPHAEVRTSVSGPVFLDVTAKALGHLPSFQQQMRHGSDHWRTVLDGACGIDVYGNNGIAAGDYNNDGFDDLYVSQPAGLPNRLYRNRGDGTFDDVTEAAGVGVLDNTSCALFADLRNSGLQDLLVVCGGGPLLFVNQGDGTFRQRPDAFRFAHPPQGTFTHAALSDYDRDGRLDVYFCVYSYYLGLDQYHYPVPYFDARNGPPNFLMHNEGDGTFTDRTEAAGLNLENNRYSFACAWNESPTTHAPDLYVVNDFGRNNLYRNQGDGTFRVVSEAAHAEDVGAGMSACWLDPRNTGENDIYVANMWSAAGLRVSAQPRFHPEAPEPTRALYRQHAHGNTLYQPAPGAVFQNVTEHAAVEMGRWAWCSDSFDFDHDGFADLYVTNGYITAPDTPGALSAKLDLGSFFWRQLVAKSPNDDTPSIAYEHGWNAINELIRSDNSWSGSERNVLFANNHDGTFSDASAVAGLDLLEDGRSFALADLDHDGRLEVIVKNRSSPQLRVLHNSATELGDSIAFHLRGTTSNRDAIGTWITLEAGDLRQSKSLQAGTGFLAQHAKQVFFGIGKTSSTLNATVHWPSGLTQRFAALPPNSRIALIEGTSTFTAEPFAKTTALHADDAAPPGSQPDSAAAIETWLLDPLEAPGFSLPDPTGTTRQLKDFQPAITLLTFWSIDSPPSQQLLRTLTADSRAVQSAKLTIVSINLDDPARAADARRWLAQQATPYPALFAAAEVAGIYNIIYRYLFDRRRDLPIPVSFLLNREGMIVKVYQGPFKTTRLLEDARSIPATPADRIARALPFAGTRYQGEFVRNDFTYGVAMFQHGYLDQAEESFRQVVRARPNDAEGFYNLGTLNLRKNNLAEARSWLEKTVTLRPDYPEAWNNLGMIAAQQGHPDEAIGNFRHSIQQRPGYATALLNLGNVYRRQGAFADAKSALEQALALQPDDPESNYSLGMFYAQQGQLEPAERYLTQAATLRPDYPEALNNLGVISVRQQQLSKAEEQFKTCIRIVPGFDQAYLNLARLYVQQHDKAKATAILKELLALKPDSVAGRQGMQMVEAAP